MKSSIYSILRSAPLLLLACQPSLWAQNNVVTVSPLKKISIVRNETATVKVAVEIRSGYHVNSNTPRDQYLIPIRLTWNPAPLEVGEIVYPKPQMEKFEFSPMPVSVFSGNFDIATKFKAPATAPVGPAIVSGKLRYQACNDTMCLPPKTIDISLTVDVVK